LKTIPLIYDGKQSIPPTFNMQSDISHDKNVHPEIGKMIDRGIPVWRADFHSAVNNTDDVPENYFSSKSQVPSRKVDMWWIPGDGILCYHKGEYFMVPSATVKFHKFI